MLPGQLTLEMPKGGAPMPPKASIVRSADVNGETRWSLGRVWDETRPRVLFIGHNPNEADAQREDGSSLRWTHFGWSWGFGGYDAVNLYPIKTPHPTLARSWAATSAGAAMMAGNRELVVSKAREAVAIVACWGAIADPAIVDNLLMRLDDEIPGRELRCFGFTRWGMPTHVMARGQHRVPDDAEPKLWRICGKGNRRHG